jgi:hypothetical protein
MARNVNNRLASLNTRRRGLDRLMALDETARLDVLAKSAAVESYQKRAEGKPYTRYALGAMEEVGTDYTRISLAEAERVAKQLESGLTAAGIVTEFRIQGSVPANVHIRGVSDVDLLTIDASFFTYDTHGYRARAGFFNAPISYTPLSALLALRRESEKTLTARFPKATVDTEGSKAIKISGGSLRRPVDVVPSHWHDTADYQATQALHDRGVRILNKAIPDTPLNMPFRHIKLLGDRDAATSAGLKKAIRLCKNVKSDAIEEGTEIALPSFDIAAVMYHADIAALGAGAINELAILAETQRHLDALACNHALAQTLMVPDGSRRIFDTTEKLNGLNRLSIEMDDLADEVANEQNALIRLYQKSWPAIRDTLRKAYLPAAA